MALAAALGTVVTAMPAAAQDKTLPGIEDQPWVNLQQVNITGDCQRAGIGLIYIKFVCANSKRSECNTRISKNPAAALVVTREEARIPVRVEEAPMYFVADVLNTAAFRSCEDGAPVAVKEMELKNIFKFDGLNLESCSVGASGDSDGAGPDVGCTIKARHDTVEDDWPAKCSDCSELNADMYQYRIRYAPVGAVSRYMHEARGRFRSYSGNTTSVSAVVDVGI
ncbi:hypothetical protein D5S17_13095 [Pseudonocardiaceae bacterium YIM PH 21723]|nr:hypothetical protein D5S17_13095 [Pseudonocardiaceae bacterium YIM PH 21723]